LLKRGTSDAYLPPGFAELAKQAGLQLRVELVVSQFDSVVMKMALQASWITFQHSGFFAHSEIILPSAEANSASPTFPWPIFKTADNQKAKFLKSGLRQLGCLPYKCSFHATPVTCK
jgi:hypothetical protein